MIIDINTYQQFLFIYKRSSRLVIIFYRSSGERSKLMLREFNKYSRDSRYRDINFVAVDFDVFEEITDIYDIQEPPKAMFVANTILEKHIAHDEIYLIEEYLDELMAIKPKEKIQIK
jgi:hypothetical protein